MLDEFRSTSITWDKATRRIYSPITANASDSNGRKLNIQVVNSGQVENLTGATLHLYWETKDKAHDGLDAFDASDISKGEFELFYTTGMLSNVGELNATLVLVDSTGKVVSDWFKITVTRGINEGAIQSENSFSSLTQALIDISNLEQNYTPRLNDLTAQLQQTKQELTTQLQHIDKNQINPYKIGLDGKSTEDVGELMQQFLNLSINAGIKKVVFPKGDYILSRPLNAYVDDLEVDFNGSTLRWRGTTDLQNVMRSQGVVKVHGVLGVTTNVVEFVAKEELFNVSLDSDSFFSSTLACKVKTNNNAVFEVGDYVILTVSTGKNTFDTLLPMAEVICEILDKTSDGYLILDYYSPFDWSGKTVTGTVKKVTPRKNVIVKNLNIIDEVVVSPNYNTDGQRGSFVSGVSYLYTVGGGVENINGNNTKFPLILNRYSHSFNGKNIKLNKPAIWGGGEGYTTQLIFSNKCVMENIYGVRERHNVDISGGAFYVIRNAISHRPKFMPMDMHGICEHSIVWENCIGHTIMCNGIYEFPCLVDNVHFINHKGAITCGGTDSYASNVKVIDSDVTLTNYHALTTVFENSKVTVNTISSNYDLFPNKRGSSEKSVFKVLGGVLDLRGSGGITTLNVKYDTFFLKGTTTTNNLNVPASSRTVLSFFDNVDIYLIDNEFNDVDRFIFTQTTSKDVYMTVKNNTYKYHFGDKSGRTIVEFNAIADCKVFLNFDGNRSHYKNPSPLTLILLQESTGNFGSSEFYISGTGNKFIGDSANSIKMFLFEPTTSYKLSHIMLQNIFKNYQGTLLDETYNKIIQ